MRPLRIAIAAERDLDDILGDSDMLFGAVVADRYRRLIAAALFDIRDDVDRQGVRVLESGVRTYHVRHSRLHLPRGQTVARPRHLLVFRLVGDGIVLLRVLHDAMDLPARLSEL